MPVCQEKWDREPNLVVTLDEKGGKPTPSLSRKSSIYFNLQITEQKPTGARVGVPDGS